LIAVGPDVTFDWPEGTTLFLAVRDGKFAGRDLPPLLPAVERAALSHLRAGRDVLVVCTQGRNRSAAVLLMLLVLWFDEVPASADESAVSMRLRDSRRPQEDISKALVKQRLLWLQLLRPVVQPSRALMQALNGYFHTQPGTAPSPTP
jgi:hypothetical protein